MKGEFNASNAKDIPGLMHVSCISRLYIYSLPIVKCFEGALSHFYILYRLVNPLWSN